MKKYLGKRIKVVVDRPLGSKHPKHDIIYNVNYGYIPNSLAGDGEEIDAYILGENYPLNEFEGIVIAIIHRKNDNEDKLIVVREDKNFTEEEIRREIDFVEKYFDIEVVLYKNINSK